MRGYPFYLGFVKDVWVATGGGTNQFHPTKLSWYHFIKDANSRMDVPMAMNILLGSVAGLMQSVLDKIEIGIANLRKKEMLLPLIHFIEKWNRMVDIMLGYAFGSYTRENGRNCQLELLSFLRWLTKWYNDHIDRIEKKTTYCNGKEEIK